MTMKSKSKKALMISEIELIIEDSFGSKIGKIKELSDGWFNTAYSHFPFLSS